MSRGLPAFLLLSLLAFARCGEEPASETARPTIDTETFTDALSDLVVARIETLPDTAAYRVRSAQILADHRITEEELRAFAEVHGQEDDRMTRIYARVEARLDSLYPSGEAVAPVDSNVDSAGEDSAPAQ